jgi:hypothetical protein
MAAHAPASTNRTRYWCVRQFALRETACLLGIALASLGFTIPAHSQTPSQQYVFAVIPGANASFSNCRLRRMVRMARSHPFRAPRWPAGSKDSIGGGLAAAPANTATLAFETGHAAADPEGEYLYSSQNDGIHAFQIDPQSGSLLELAGSPFPTAAAGAGFLGISGTPGQAVSGPFAAVFPALQDFGGVNVGGSSNPKTVSVTNTGDQALVLTAWSIQGADAGDLAPPQAVLSLRFFPQTPAPAARVP